MSNNPRIAKHDINYKLEVTVVNEVFQSEGSATQNGVPTAYIKKREELIDGKWGTFPYYTANGHRGMMHRVIADIVMDRAEQKGISMEGEITDFHFLTAGGGSNYQNQPLAIELEARALNPIISVFGVSLAVEGKMMNTNLIPIDKQYREQAGKDTLRSKLIGYETFIKEDSVDKKIGKRYLSQDEIDEYMEEVSDVQEARAQERNAKDGAEKKTKKLSIQAFNAREFIQTGAVLVGYIGSKENFTSIEKGMLLTMMEKMMPRRLGGGSNNFKGVVTYKITTEVDGGVRDVMSTEVNTNNLANPIVTTNYDKDELACIAEFDAWLDAVTEKEIFVSRTLKA